MISMVILALCDAAVELQLLLSLSTASLAAGLIYFYRFKPTAMGLYTLIFAATVMSLGVIFNVYMFSVESGGTLADPVLLNPDSYRYYNHAVEIYTGEHIVREFNVVGLPLITAALWAIFGQSIVYPLAMNVFLTLLSLMLAGRLAQILLRGYVANMTDEKVMSLAMLLTTAVCYFIGHGMLMLKEPLLYVGVLLMAICVAHFYRKERLTTMAIIGYLVGNAIIAVSRPQLSYFLFVALVLFVFVDCRKLWKKFVVLIAIAGVFYFIGMGITRVDLSLHDEIVAGGERMDSEYLNDPKDGRYDTYNKITGGYYNTPFYHRVALLPLTATVQYVVPFPWNFERDMEFGYSQIYSHIAYPWYVVGGMILFYYLFMWWRRKTPLRLWALWTLFLWVVVAYLYAGSVSRYILPFVPLMIPFAVLAISRLIDGEYRKQFAVWSICYVTVMAVGLVACYHIQQI